MKKFNIQNVSKESIEQVGKLLNTSPQNLSTIDIETALPMDVVTNVKFARLRNGSVEQFINVVPVTAMKGRRVIKERSQVKGLAEVLEGDVIPGIDTPKLNDVSFSIKKYMGFFHATSEQLQDATEETVEFVAGIVADETRVTRNKATFETLNQLAKVSLPDVNAIKKQMNTTLRRVKRNNMVISINNDGFEYLDEQTINGEPLLKESETSNSGFKLFGVDVEVFDNEELPTVDGNMPFIFGDLYEAVTLFDREIIEVRQTELTKQDFLSFTNIFRIRDGFDVQLASTDLAVYGQIAKP